MSADSPVKILLVAAALVVVVAGMRAASPILVPFLLAVFVAVISAPPLFWLRDRGLPQSVALILVITAISILGAAVIALAGTSIDDFSRALPEYQARLKADTAGLFVWLNGYGITVETSLRGLVNPGRAMELAGSVFNGLGNMLANAFLIFLTVIFILLEASGFTTKFRLAVADPEASLARFRDVAEKINHYLAIKTWASLATGSIIGIWLAILGVDFALLWGMLAFLLNYVPNIGAIIAAVPAVLLALVQLGPGAALWSAVAFLVVNNIIGSIIEPRFMGRKLGLSTLVVFLSLVFWGWVLGPVGMFLSVPLTMTIKIALEARMESRWIAVLLGNEADGNSG